MPGVNGLHQDDPGTCHLFYADAEGHPGSDLTFFPWAHLARPRAGHGMAMEVGLHRAVLFRAMVPLVPDPLPLIPRTPVLISNGRLDRLISPKETDRLVS
jgi:catechol 2,3-dioxygenase-like lactoylglutathione lyase family enzyme